MNRNTSSKQAPLLASAELPSGDGQPLVLCRHGRQIVFPLPGIRSDNQLSKRLGTIATFVFPTGTADCLCSGDAAEAGMLHDQIVCTQTRNLSRHVEALERVFVISDIYAHPLIRKDDILNGHRLVSFAGAPIRNASGRMIGTVCTVDIKVRDWRDEEIRSLKEIAAQIADCQLW